MENNNYVSVGNIIEQERLKRQAQIAKGVSSDVYDHIEKAHQDDLSKGVEMTDNLSRFADDVDNLNKAETEFLLSKLQRQIVVDPESSLLKSFKSIAINHLNDLEKAHQDGEMHPNGKWVWVSSANGGKGDWRTANGRVHKKHQETNGKKDGEGNSVNVVEKQRKTNNGNFKGMKLTEILDSLDYWGDDDWNNQSLNEKLSVAISSAIKSEKIDEKKFNEIAKKYQGLDLVYTDYADLDDKTKVKRAMSDFAKLLQPLDDWDDSDWNDKQKNIKLENDIKMVIRKNRLSEKQFKAIAKQYQGLDLVYTDFIPKNSSEYKKFN